MYPPRCRWCGLCLPLQQIGGCVYLRGPLFVPAWLCCLCFCLSAFVAVFQPLSFASFASKKVVAVSYMNFLLSLCIPRWFSIFWLCPAWISLFNSAPKIVSRYCHLFIFTHDCNVNVLRWCILFGAYAGATYTLTQHGHLWLMLSQPSHEIGKGSTAPNRNAI